MAQFGSVRITPSKVQQVLAAGEKQLSPEEFEELTNLIFDMQIYGLTPWINVRLGTLMSKIEWELEIEPSPEWEEALQACDRAFLGNELKAMCYDYGMSPSGHKKELCASLYNANVPAVVAVMKPYLEEETAERLPKTEPIYAPTLRKVKDRLEELHRKAPEEFSHRKKLIEKAIKERQDGFKITMPEQTLGELRELLDFTIKLERSKP